jgi:xanthine dehydrogenase molybdopterin-binding subunit B
MMRERKREKEWECGSRHRPSFSVETLLALRRYTVGYTGQGVLTAVKMDYFVNSGCTPTDGDGVIGMAFTACDAAYYAPTWLVTPHLCKTNAPPRTWCRAPGVTPAMFFMEVA